MMKVAVGTRRIAETRMYYFSGKNEISEKESQVWYLYAKIG
jgi:hypothetical protein